MCPLLLSLAQALLLRLENSRKGMSFINNTANNTVSNDVNREVSTQVSGGAAMEMEGRNREEGEEDGRNGGGR